MKTAAKRHCHGSAGRMHLFFAHLPCLTWSSMRLTSQDDGAVQPAKPRSRSTRAVLLATLCVGTERCLRPTDFSGPSWCSCLAHCNRVAPVFSDMLMMFQDPAAMRLCRCEQMSAAEVTRNQIGNSASLTVRFLALRAPTLASHFDALCPQGKQCHSSEP